MQEKTTKFILIMINNNARKRKEKKFLKCTYPTLTINQKRIIPIYTKKVIGLYFLFLESFIPNTWQKIYQDLGDS